MFGSFSDEFFFHYKSRLQQEECQALFPTKVCGCGSGLKTQPEGQALSKIGVLGVIDSGKQNSPPSFASANKVINKYKHMEVLIQHVMAWIRRVYTDGAYTFQQGSVPTHTTEKTEEFLKLKNMKVMMMEL